MKMNKGNRHIWHVFRIKDLVFVKIFQDFSFILFYLFQISSFNCIYLLSLYFFYSILKKYIRIQQRNKKEIKTTKFTDEEAILKIQN